MNKQMCRLGRMLESDSAATISHLSFRSKKGFHSGSFCNVGFEGHNVIAHESLVQY